MTDKLHDPDQPAGAIINWEVDDEGIRWGIRNDGEKLKSAEHNPWYVLMTIAGEQTGNDFDVNLAKQNRKYWNAWAGQALGDADRAKWAKKAGIEPEELAAWDDLKAEIKEDFETRLDEDTAIPDPSEFVNLSATAFSNTIVLEKAVFSADAWFNDATFSADASFDRTIFSADALFNSAMFEGYPKFGRTRFGKFTSFADATFNKPVSFRDAAFETEYPNLDGCNLPDRTEFTAERKGEAGISDGTTEHRQFWPDIPGNLTNARKSAAAIRHLVARQGLPEAEHFFFTREMTFKRMLGATEENGGWLGLQLNRAYWALSGYGGSVGRPIAGILINISLFWGFFGTYLHIILGVANTFAFLGFHRTYFGTEFLQDLGPWATFFSGAQTVFGVISLFFLGLGLRTRFRLR